MFNRKTKLDTTLEQIAKSAAEKGCISIQAQIVTRKLETVTGHPKCIRGIAVGLLPTGDQVQLGVISMDNEEIDDIIKINTVQLLYHPGFIFSVQLRPTFSINIAPTADFPYAIQWELPLGKDIKERSALLREFVSGKGEAERLIFSKSGVLSTIHIAPSAATFSIRDSSVDTAEVPTSQPGPVIVSAEQPTEPAVDQLSRVIVEKNRAPEPFDNDLVSNILAVTRQRATDLEQMTPEERKEASKYDPIENVKEIVARRKEDGTIQQNEADKKIVGLFQGSNDPEDIKRRLEALKGQLVNKDGEPDDAIFDEPEEDQNPTARVLSDHEVDKLLTGLSGTLPNPQQAEIDQIVEDHSTEMTPPPDGFESAL